MTLQTNIAAVGAFALTIDGVTPSVSLASEAKLTLQAAHLPIRLLIPVLGNDAQLSPLTIGGNGLAVTAQYSITDLLLWRLVGQGTNMTQDHSPLLQYVDQWVGVLAQNRSLTTGASLEVVSIAPGIFSFDRKDYLGCEVRLRMTEHRRFGT